MLPEKIIRARGLEFPLLLLHHCACILLLYLPAVFHRLYPDQCKGGVHGPQFLVGLYRKKKRTTNVLVLLLFCNYYPFVKTYRVHEWLMADI